MSQGELTVNVLSKSRPKHSVKNVFGIKDLTDFEKALCPDLPECKLIALRGDALLLVAATNHVLSNHDASSVGEASKKRQMYIQNNTMARFLTTMTDLPQRVSVERYNNHSLGTIFEALFFIAHRDNTPARLQSLLTEYFNWADENPVMELSLTLELSPKSNGRVSVIIVDSYGQEQEPIEIDSKSTLDMSPQITSLFGLVKFQEQIKQSETTANFTELARAQSKTQQLPPKLQLFPPHSQGIVEVQWSSRARYVYKDPYFQCCGVRESRKHCLLPLWPDPLATHTGRLQISCSSRVGGGHYQGHLPRGNTPVWTCCHRTSVAPGCVPSPSLDKTKYKETVEQWITEYDTMIKAEQDVFHVSQILQ